MCFCYEGVIVRRVQRLQRIGVNILFKLFSSIAAGCTFVCACATTVATTVQ